MAEGGWSPCACSQEAESSEKGQKAEWGREGRGEALFLLFMQPEASAIGTLLTFSALFCLQTFLKTFPKTHTVTHVHGDLILNQIGGED